MRSKMWAATLFVAAFLPVSADAQGIARGAQDGARTGSSVAGPLGGAVGGLVGGAVGGAAGGVKGVLGVPQRTGLRRSYRGRYDRRGRRRD